MRTTIIAIVSVTFLTQTAFASGPWSNEPAGSHTFLDCPFNSLGECRITGGGPAIVTDGNAPVSPSNVAKSTLVPGANRGGSDFTYYTPQLNKELFIGIMWRTNPEFQGRQVGNKMFFVGSPAGAGLFLFGGGGTQGMADKPIIWSFNSSALNNDHLPGGSFGCCTPNAGSGMAHVGTWTKIEAYVKGSTTTTSKDGILRWWINGQPAGNYENVNWYAPAFSRWTWTETWDGTVNPVPSVEWNHFIDHLYISAPNFVLSLPKTLNDTIPSMAQSGKRYTAYLNAFADYTPVTWTISDGSLPGGLVLGEKTGVISGIPTTCGLHNFTIKATDAKQSTAVKSFSLNVTGTCTSGIQKGGDARVLNNEPKNGMLRVESHFGSVQFNLPSAKTGKYQLSIYDLSGKIVHACSGAEGNVVMVKATLGNGVYLAKLRQGSRVSTARFNVLN